MNAVEKLQKSLPEGWELQTVFGQAGDVECYIDHIDRNNENGVVVDVKEGGLSGKQ